MDRAELQATDAERQALAAHRFALIESLDKPLWYQRFTSAPYKAAFAALALAALSLSIWLPNQAGVNGSGTLTASAEVDLEMIEDVEFYLWMAEQS